MILFLLACSTSGEDSAAGTCDREPPLTYEAWGQGFLDRYCTGCHASLIPTAQRIGAPESVNLETYADVLQYAERIVARVNDESAPMPPGGGPTDAEKVLLAEWIACEVTSDQEKTSSEGSK